MMENSIRHYRSEDEVEPEGETVTTEYRFQWPDHDVHDRALVCCEWCGACCQGCRAIKGSDRGVIFLLVGLVLFSLAYLFAKSSGHQIAPVDEEHSWTYACINDSMCLKHKIVNASEEEVVGWNKCSMFCGNPSGGLWPKPTGHLKLSNSTFNFLPGDVTVTLESGIGGEAKKYLNSLRALLKKSLLSIDPSKNDFAAHRSANSRLVLKIHVEDQKVENPLEGLLNPGKDGNGERYSLKLRQMPEVTRLDHFQADIDAQTVFGARHALETFLQLLTYDEITATLQTYDSISIFDRPFLSYRGLMLDTFGSFVTVPAIKRLIDGMALNKMNALHWKRQEEEQSDVLRRRTRPRLPHETYSSGDILDVVEYARLRGVQVVPEYELGGKLFGKARNPSGCDVHSIKKDVLDSVDPLSPLVVHITGDGHIPICNATEAFAKVGTSLAISWDRKMEIGRLRYLKSTAINDTVAPKAIVSYPLRRRDQQQGGGSTGDCEADASSFWPGGNNRLWKSFYLRAKEVETEVDLVGAEVLIWTGNGGLDEASMETAVWPAVAAMAENAWTRNQENEDLANVVSRLSSQRLRMVERSGLSAGVVIIQ